MLKVGLAKQCINPPLKSVMAGFAARNGVAQSVHDDLYVRALVIDNGHTSVFLLSLEVIALSSDFVRNIRCALQENTGIPPQNILCAATHTHCGPVTVKAFFNSDEDIDQAYGDFLKDQAIKTAAQAWHERSPAHIGIGSTKVTELGVNRCSADGKPVDEEVGILEIVNEGEHIRGMLINYGCHPTVLGPNTLQITGDFPAFALNMIEQQCGKDCLALFLNGPQGNIGPGHSSAKSAIGIIDPARTFSRAEAIGKILAHKVLEAIPEINLANNPVLDGKIVVVQLPPKRYPPVKQIETQLHEVKSKLEKIKNNTVKLNEKLPANLEQLRLQILYKTIELYYAYESEHLSTIEVEIQAIRIGPCAFLALPAEVFTEIGMEIKKRSPLKTYVVALANGYIGYLPNRQAYVTGGYECVASGLAPEAADHIIERSLELLHSFSS